MVNLSEDDIAALALRAGMKPAEIIELLDTIARWRSLGLDIEADALPAQLASMVTP